MSYARKARCLILARYRRFQDVDGVCRECAAEQNSPRAARPGSDLALELRAVVTSSTSGLGSSRTGGRRATVLTPVFYPLPT